MLVKSLVLLAHLLEMRFIGPVWTERTDHLAGSLLLGSSYEWLYRHTKPHSGSRSSLLATITRGLAAWSQRRLLPLTLVPGTVLGLVQPSRLEATPPSTLSANHPLFSQSSVFWLVDQLCFCSGCLALQLGLGAHTQNPSPGRLWQEDHLSLRPARLMTEFQANLGCRMGFCLRTKTVSVWDHHWKQLRCFWVAVFSSSPNFVSLFPQTCWALGMGLQLTFENFYCWFAVIPWPCHAF